MALVLSLINCFEGLVNNTIVVYKSFHKNFYIELNNNLTLEVEREFVVELRQVQETDVEFVEQLNRFYKELLELVLSIKYVV